MDQQPQIQQPVMQQSTSTTKQTRQIPTKTQRNWALVHPVLLLLAALSFKFAASPVMASLPGLILFSKGFFTGVFVLILMDVISFGVPHLKRGAPPIPLFQDLDQPVKCAFWLGVAVLSVEGVIGWHYGWEGETGWVFGLGALVTGILYEQGMRKFVQWAIE